MLRPGQEMGKFVLLKLLGKGGFSQVWLARNPYTLTGEDEIVALKFPVAQEWDLVKLLVEPKMLASLEHPNIVKVFSAERAEGLFFIVMEYMAGGSLAQRIKERGPLTEADIVEIISQVLRGLDQAHRAGVVHRDVKPENIFFAADGTVKLGDFGVAATLEGSGRALGTVGSLRYKAPEQFQGLATAASDVWAVGVTLYIMATGRFPFGGRGRPEIQRAIFEFAPPSPRRLGAKISPQLEAVITQALEKDPARRPPNAGELLALLRAARLQSAPVPPLMHEAWRSLASPRGARQMASAGDLLWLAGVGLWRYDRVLNEWHGLFSEHGLPTNEVRAVAAHGRDLWLGTAHGAYHYDPGEGGWRAVVDPAGPGEQPVNAVLIEEEDIWVGTEQGLFRLRRATGRWQSYTAQTDPLPSDLILCLAGDEYSLWVGTAAGAVRYDKWSESWETFPDQPAWGQAPIHSVAVGDQEVWLATDRSLSRYAYRERTGQTWPLSAQALTQGLPTLALSPVAAWVGVGSQVLAVRREVPSGPGGKPPVPSKAELQRLPVPQGLLAPPVGSLMAGGRRLWVAHADGLARYDWQAKQWAAVPLPAGPVGATIKALWPAEGALWVATERGLNRYHRATDAWDFWPLAALPAEEVTALALSQGVYVGTERGLRYYDEVLEQWRTVEGPASTAPVTALTVAGAHLWVGGPSGLARFDPLSGEWDPFGPEMGFPAERVTCLLTEGLTVWAGTSEGHLCRYDPQRQEWEVCPLESFLPLGEILALWPAENGLWVGSVDGLQRYEIATQRWRLVDLPPEWTGAPVTALVGAGWTLWVGTDQGLARYHPERDLWEVFTPAEGLAAEKVTALAWEGDTLWVGTEGGGLCHGTVSRLPTTAVSTPG